MVCDGLLVEYGDGIGECDLHDACQAIGLRDDYPAYRAAHDRVIDRGQSENKDEYGGEARLGADSATWWPHPTPTAQRSVTTSS